MAHSISIRAVDRLAISGADRSRVCSLAFRPSRFFVCRIEEVLADFFLCDDLKLAGMPEVAWDLLHSIVRAKLDERVTVDAAFSPALAQDACTSASTIVCPPRSSLALSALCNSWIGGPQRMDIIDLGGVWLCPYELSPGFAAAWWGFRGGNRSW